MGHEEIMDEFLEQPANSFQIRKLARDLGISKTAVSYHMDKLVKQGMVLKEKGGVFPAYRANQAGEVYRFEKREAALRKIIRSGLLDYLEEECQPRCIVLFGSFAKAEYDSKSDIDLFLQAGERVLKLTRFEKRLKHRINVLFEPELGKLSPELLNNIINGIKLRGYIKLR